VIYAVCSISLYAVSRRELQHDDDAGFELQHDDDAGFEGVMLCHKARTFASDGKTTRLRIQICCRGGPMCPPGYNRQFVSALSLWNIQISDLKRKSYKHVFCRIGDSN